MDSLTLYVLLVHVSFSFKLSCPVVAQGSSPAAMFVFGDSLSDVGNNNYINTTARCNFPHYGIDYPGGKPTGRFSNGKNFVDLLAEKLRVPSPKPYLSLFKTDNPLEFLEGVNFASGSAGILTSTHQRILELGARKLVFIGTEPVGCWPAVRASNKSPGDCNKEINEASSLYNEEVVLLLKKLQSEYSDMRYSFFHSYRVFDKFIKHPENYGFNESKAACCGMGNLNAEFACNPLAKYCSDRTKYVFWDGWHQTEATANLLVSMAFDGLPPNVFPVNVRELSGLNAENAHVIDQ
ncbi:hypothetical protein J5N97_011330 [Dioscorea zingiberensis]|uniref:GDSL esterase/lipase n=1 Tax=Dioscorea zingiberensis TaxID=325984 RepID=A0A9D5D060_9LILI|nr:hypothetical protein J5N97_011330 [Dioscorea zingiberensis]